MNQTKYLIDNNALNELGPEHRGSEFFRAHCRLPTEVLHEAQGSPDVTSLKRLAYELTPGVLEHVRRVMKSIQVGDTDLVDLYRNKGSADPVIIACALDATEQEQGRLLSDNWVIVSSDKALVRCAQTFGIKTAAPAQLAALIDADGARIIQADSRVGSRSSTPSGRAAIDRNVGK